MNFSDIFYIFKWFLAFFVIGVTFLPLTFSLFNNFKDKGYIFSKILGIAFISYFIFILGTLHILKFSQTSVFLSILFFLFLNYFVITKGGFLQTLKKNLKIFIFEEIIFLATIFVWSYVRSNLPDINGLEKFMDFGFLNSILRSDYLPPKDIWYTPSTINYYYFGHLMSAVLTKLSATPSFISYNLMIAALFALTFTASLSLGMNIFDNKKFSIKSNLAGIFSAVFVTLSGNLTTIYAFFKPYVNDNPVPFWNLRFLPFDFPNGFWYPNATRFIPYTIHEFPLYSFVVSDLHGHVLDIPFVLLMIALLYSLISKSEIRNWKLEIGHLLLISFLLAVMYMTNAWDGFIYLLLTLLLFPFLYFYKNGKGLFFSIKNLYELVKNFLTVLLGFISFSIPFSLSFKPFVSGIGVLCAPSFLTNLGKLGPFLFEVNHCQKSPIWQFILLYGFFYFFVFSFIIFIKFKKHYKFSKNDAFILILITLSSLLLIVPEFIYIKDIYPMHYRANTMFKLTYEAFIMLSICSGFILIKLFSNIKNKILLCLFFLISVFLISLNLTYPFFAVGSYYRELKNYKNLDGTFYLSSLHPQDYKLINWANQNIKGQPIILEASGDSYTDYARISANTGLPTVIGWSVHEWLWRGTYDVVAPRIEDVKTLYTGTDINLIKILLTKYKISYVVVSSLEKEKYPNLNENNFKKLGKEVYQNNETKLYRINYGAF